jgi:3-oxoacyl-[acyl-carrier protein] reductase
MMRLKDKVAIVTGGGRDIGREVSIKLAAEGARVCINYANDAASAIETLHSIEIAGGTAIVCRADVTLASEVDGLIETTQRAFGPQIDILVNVAGGMVARRPLSEIDEEFFDRVMTLNLKSTFLVTRATVPHMPPGAAIVNLSSQAGRDGGGPGASIYATAKGAVSTFTRAIAKELGVRGIRVNAVCPGIISTSFHDTFSKPEVRTAVAAATALRREGRASEVAEVVAFLASQDASFLSGVNLDVNGGLLFS